MNRLTLAAAALSFVLPISPAPVEARPDVSSGFWSSLDRNGALSAGWVQVLPVLASACNLKLDSRELNAKLVDLSQDTGNSSYATNLYWTLYLMDKHRATNNFVKAWNARFMGRQKEACETAEALWGSSGHQFPGVLKREALLDSTGTVPPNATNGCH
ncbi:hypothetical protein [Lichenifustis flavocetrariae]|uniref:Uncharacterized protein n=1 Tax=Lichenifustis flavocetrariae TaxID=2949735 RepID=A0AA42CNG0_9HYPH|nr:hypothetical protein [Lichenifustis flavocetrariae]MCW6509377.1 hypothetical protein [Lichenifustis flavocetrariae]